MKIAYGGVLVNEQGCVLLRKPANEYDGYVWTFPKGRQEPGESPEQTALREVLEETGYQAEIIEKIPGSFDGGTTRNGYFLMRPVGNQQPTDWETAETIWVPMADAAKYIRQTRNDIGRKRDLAVLSEAIVQYSKLEVQKE